MGFCFLCGFNVVGFRFVGFDLLVFVCWLRFAVLWFVGFEFVFVGSALFWHQSGRHELLHPVPAHPSPVPPRIPITEACSCVGCSRACPLFRIWGRPRCSKIPWLSRLSTWRQAHTHMTLTAMGCQTCNSASVRFRTAWLSVQLHLMTKAELKCSTP